MICDVCEGKVRHHCNLWRYGSDWSTDSVDQLASQWDVANSINMPAFSHLHAEMNSSAFWKIKPILELHFSDWLISPNQSEKCQLWADRISHQLQSRRASFRHRLPQHSTLSIEKSYLLSFIRGKVYNGQNLFMERVYRLFSHMFLGLIYLWKFVHLWKFIM